MMTFENPDSTFGEQAGRVHKLYELICDMRDKHSSEDTDARRVNLNNVAMAANASTAILRLFHWAKNGGERALTEALGLAKPEYINFVAEDVLRSSRLFLLLESQFQIETLFRNVLIALGIPAGKQGFYNVAKDVLEASGINDREVKLRILNVGALLRNSMHANGVHHGFKGSSTNEQIDGVDFHFENGQRVQCGSWLHIITAIGASMRIVDEVLSAAKIKVVALIPDAYAVQRAESAE